MDKRLVKAVWRDAQASSTIAFAEHEIPHAAIEITTVGWLLRQDESGVSIANEYCADATWRGLTYIPAGMLVKLEDVKKARASRTRVPTPAAEHP